MSLLFLKPKTPFHQKRQPCGSDSDRARQNRGVRGRPADAKRQGCRSAPVPNFYPERESNFCERAKVFKEENFS